MRGLKQAICWIGVWAAAVAFGANVGETIYLPADSFHLATGNPSLLCWTKGSTPLPVWSLSGGTVGQSIAGITPPLPSDCAGVKVEILVTASDASADPKFSDVYRMNLSQVVEGESVGCGESIGKPVRTPLAAPWIVRRIVLDSYRPVRPGVPLVIRIQREPGDPDDTFVKPTGLISVAITPLTSPPTGQIVQNAPGYNSWPMMQAIGEKLVCTYSKGKGHNIIEGIRGVYARTSTDGGKTWTQETCVANDPAYGEVTIGKGLDNDGAMLLWIRCFGGPTPHHDLYRSVDGVTFTRLATPALSPLPVQITDVIHLPSGKLMSLWFAGSYNEKKNKSWGTLTSEDNGKTWTQRTVEKELEKDEWPTEQSVVYLGDGRILGIARTESGTSQFQLTSVDDGTTWKRMKTNIRDVMASSPSLIYDPETKTVSNYYYERGRGVIRRRAVAAETVFGNPYAWPDSEPVGIGSDQPWESGNVNATRIGNTHYLSYYSGKGTNTTVFVLPVN
ncbi:MAG: exo-alpha-sialidase [Kiritimatiellae bacterium]|nr:exo-alpha-sialidase [Kiritimatiellia bacterium]